MSYHRTTSATWGASTALEKEMKEIKEVDDRIYQVQVSMDGQSYIYTAYIIYEEQAVLIDPGPASILPAIEKAMKRIGLNNLAYIIPTHIHIDHSFCL